MLWRELSGVRSGRRASGIQPEAHRVKAFEYCVPRRYLRPSHIKRMRRTPMLRRRGPDGTRTAKRHDFLRESLLPGARTLAHYLPRAQTMDTPF